MEFIFLLLVLMLLMAVVCGAYYGIIIACIGGAIYWVVSLFSGLFKK